VSQEPSLDDLTSKKGWTSIGYDKNIWIPCPNQFPPSLTKQEWARGFAEAWWDAVPGHHSEQQARELEQALVFLHDNIYDYQPCHVVLIHLPDARMTPLAVCFGIWQSLGDRDSQLRALVHADDPAAVEPPIIEEVRTEHLGAGLKSLYYQRESHGSGLFTALNYAWRSEEYETDLRVFCGCPDMARMQRAIPDIEALTREISIVPHGQQ
jgi:hypothetical protein